MAAFPGGDKLRITYEGPPRMEGGKEVSGDKFCLSGERSLQCAEGVELARGMSGIFRAPRDYRYDTTANQPGSTFVDSVANRRKFDSAINILGDSPSEFRQVFRKWLKNHPVNQEGKLWFETSDAPRRYSFVRASTEAGMSSVDVDPNIMSKLDDFAWGWESDYPFLFGETQKINYSSTGVATFTNPSDAGPVYPVIFLPGPGIYKVGGITTPSLASNETIRINFDPERESYVKRNNTTGVLTNLWYTLNGKRPKFEIAPFERVTHRITVPSSSHGAYMQFVPLYEGAF